VDAGIAAGFAREAFSGDNEMERLNVAMTENPSSGPMPEQQAYGGTGGLGKGVGHEVQGKGRHGWPTRRAVGDKAAPRFFFCARAPEEAVTHLNLTTEQAVVEAALFLSSFPADALTGQSSIVSHGVPIK
jgi:hypothetical protein